MEDSADPAHEAGSVRLPILEAAKDVPPFPKLAGSEVLWEGATELPVTVVNAYWRTAAMEALTASFFPKDGSPTARQ